MKAKVKDIMAKGPTLQGFIEHGVNTLIDLERFFEHTRREFGDVAVYLIILAYFAQKEEKE